MEWLATGRQARGESSARFTSSKEIEIPMHDNGDFGWIPDGNL
jgi:hypothetical protein